MKGLNGSTELGIYVTPCWGAYKACRPSMTCTVTLVNEVTPTKSVARGGMGLAV